LAQLPFVIDPLAPNLNAGLDELKPTFLGLTGDPARADSMAWQSISDLRDQQAISPAYFDCYLQRSVFRRFLGSGSVGILGLSRY
jgi:hypothetical protein